MECTKEEVRKERKGEDNVFQLGKLIDEISSFSQRSSLSDMNQAESGKVVPHICLVGEILQRELPSDTRAQRGGRGEMVALGMDITRALPSRT